LAKAVEKLPDQLAEGDVSMASESEVERAVLDALASQLPKGTRIYKHQRINEDLMLSSDDGSVVALKLQKTFNARPTYEEWGSISTVQEIIELLVRHSAD
jgi:acyl carrier protein